MSFENDALMYIRTLVDDTDEEDYEFTDDRLLSLIFVAASYVNAEIAEEYEISICGQTISPDPDSSFINLVSLKAACMLIKSQQSAFARAGEFKFTDGPSTVDLKGTADKLKSAADSACGTYEKFKHYVLMSEGGISLSTPNDESY